MKTNKKCDISVLFVIGVSGVFHQAQGSIESLPIEYVWAFSHIPTESRQKCAETVKADGWKKPVTYQDGTFREEGNTKASARDMMSGR